MFIPLSVLNQNEVMLETPEDVILALDRWVLPHYPDFITSNPIVTKGECLGILHSFGMAGKLHVKLKPSEVDKAIDAFLEDRLWVEKEHLETLMIAHQHKPEFWMPRPTLFRVLWMIPGVLVEAVGVIYGLIKVGILYTFYKMQKERTFEIPKCSIDRRVMSSKKNS